MSEEIVKGYKATDANMQCRGYQFELGKWHKHDGKIAMCESGFHFCEYPSGPWAFYNSDDTRIFEVEARGVIRGEGPGADLKHVAMEIRLVKEIIATGDRNTGDSNTGDSNTGHSNTGDSNTGHSNTGHMNTGDMNTGDRNTGDSNTGDSNTGHSNTGHMNTGDMNTGYRNTGDMNTGHSNAGYGNAGYGNTGDYNTGDYNTGYGNTGYGNAGDGNATDKCSGFLCKCKQRIIIFDKPVKKGVDVPNNLISELSMLMQSDSKIENIERFLAIPNATKEAILSLHEAHIARRAKK